MAQDWAKKFVEAHEQELTDKRQKEQEKQLCQRYADAGAEEKFLAIRTRIEEDLKILKRSALFHPLEMQIVSNREFKISYRGYTRVELETKLDVTIIRYQHFTSSSKSLRICSDTDGNLSVYKNGSTDACEDEEEISEFLLSPMIQEIKKIDNNK